MDAGMAAIADMKNRDSAQRSRPPPAGQDFQFPPQTDATMSDAGGPASHHSKHLSMGQPATASAEPNSIAALMMGSDDQESSLPYAQAQPGAPMLPPNPASIPIPISPSAPRFQLVDRVLPPLPDSPYGPEPAELHRRPSGSQRVAPRAFTPPGSSDFYVVPHQAHMEAYQDSGYAGGPPHPSRFAQPAFEAPWVAPEEYEKWDGAYDVPRDVYGDAEQEDKKRFKKKLVWCILGIIVVIAAIVGIAVAISKRNSSSSENNAASPKSSATSDAGDRLSSSTVVIVESASKGSPSRSTAQALPTLSATTSSPRGVSFSSTIIGSSSASISLATPTLPTSAVISSTTPDPTTTGLTDSLTETPSSPASTSTPLLPTLPVTSTTAPTRTTAPVAGPSVTCITGGRTVFGFPVGATTATLPAGASCPTSGPPTKGASRGPAAPAAAPAAAGDDGEDVDEDSGGFQSAALKRHRRVRRSEGSYRM